MVYIHGRCNCGSLTRKARLELNTKNIVRIAVKKYPGQISSKDMSCFDSPWYYALQKNLELSKEAR